MDVAEAQPETARACPSCGGELDAALTLCPRCREGLEAHVMGRTLPPEQLCFSTPATPPAKPTPAVIPAAPVAAPPVSRPAASAAAAAPTGAKPATSSLQLRRRWHTLVAVGLIFVAAVVGMSVWSFLTPHSESPVTDDEPAARASSKPISASTPPAPAGETAVAITGIEAAAATPAPATSASHSSRAAAATRRSAATSPARMRRNETR